VQVISLLEAGHSITAQQRLFEQLAPQALHNGRVSDLQDIVHMCQPSLTAPVATLAVRLSLPSSFLAFYRPIWSSLDATGNQPATCRQLWHYPGYC
jgi:hypothetical protein